MLQKKTILNGEALTTYSHVVFLILLSFDWLAAFQLELLKAFLFIAIYS